MNLVLNRVFVGVDGAFGTLAPVSGPPFILTLEHTYTDLAVKIPVGEYLCQRSRFVRGGYETFEVTGVVGHDRLLFHKGNTEDDSEGCILLGMQFGTLNGSPAVLSSAAAFALFMAQQSSVDSFTLEVRQWTS